MTDWQPIESAPTDGTPVTTGRINPMTSALGPLYTITSRYIDGRWTADFGKDTWRPYDPQPSHWKPIPSQPLSPL